ncbi:HEAT repeat domain-containing protein [Halorubellus litoreus]|uniref:HEAT repeat domain-containing protein n=2 Tax=Halorubellus litoreus TaxID=755308 RepID=A0ABD5VK96_9EURY
MVVYRCAECDGRISHSVVTLTDTTLLQTDPDDFQFSDQTGNPDMVPQGFQITNDTADYAVPDDDTGWPVLNPENVVGTDYDYTAETGCCGPPGNAVNTVCRNGHKVGVERGDCYTVHAIALDPTRVTATDSHHQETEGLDAEDPAVWLDILDSGSVSDRRRAIALLGHHETVAAVPALRDTLTAGPRELRPIAALSLGRISAPDALEALATALDTDDETVRTAVVTAIGGCDLDGTDDILLDHLADEPHEDVCREVRYGLDDQLTASTFRTYLDRSTTAAGQLALVKLLPRQGDAVASALTDTIHRSNLPTEVRKRAVVQRGHFKSDTNTGSRYREDTGEALLDALEAVTDVDVRVACIHALHNRYLHDDTIPDAVERTLHDLETDPRTPEAVRTAARDAL